VETDAGHEAKAHVDAVFKDYGEPAAPVAIIVATREEAIQATDASQELTSRGISHQLHELSPHRDAALLAQFAETAALRGVRVIIALAGVAPSLPSIVAAHTELPVVGVPLPSPGLGGLDTLLATVQCPPGKPVACMSIGGLRNAAVFAATILSAMPLPPSDGE
jgi:5-(carboxyamino)imidazole ribonucleotide mutase